MVMKIAAPEITSGQNVDACARIAQALVFDPYISPHKGYETRRKLYSRICTLLCIYSAVDPAR